MANARRPTSALVGLLRSASRAVRTANRSPALLADRVVVRGHRRPEDEGQDGENQHGDSGQQLLRHDGSSSRLPGRSARPLRPTPSSGVSHEDSVSRTLVGCDCPNWGICVSVISPTRLVGSVGGAFIPTVGGNITPGGGPAPPSGGCRTVAEEIWPQHRINDDMKGCPTVLRMGNDRSNDVGPITFRRRVIERRAIPTGRTFRFPAMHLAPPTIGIRNRHRGCGKNVASRNGTVPHHVRTDRPRLLAPRRLCREILTLLFANVRVVAVPPTRQCPARRRRGKPILATPATDPRRLRAMLAADAAGCMARHRSGAPCTDESPRLSPHRVLDCARRLRTTRSIWRLRAT